MIGENMRRSVALIATAAILFGTVPVRAQQPESPKPQTEVPPSQDVPSVRRAFNAAMPKSHNPFSAYRASSVGEPVLANSPRLQQLIRDGELHISLRDAIYLAIENNLDLAIARYNSPIADTDILRT